MKQYELFVGQPVWYPSRTMDGRKIDVEAIVVKPQRKGGSLTGIAYQYVRSSRWLPLYVQTICLRPRALAWTAIKLERHYGHLAYVAKSLPAQPHGLLAQSSLGAMDRAVGELGLRFQRDDAGHVHLVEMTDCEFDAFIAATHAASEVTR